MQIEPCALFFSAISSKAGTAGEGLLRRGRFDSPVFLSAYLLTFYISASRIRRNRGTPPQHIEQVSCQFQDYGNLAHFIPELEEVTWIQPIARSDGYEIWKNAVENHKAKWSEHGFAAVRFDHAPQPSAGSSGIFSSHMKITLAHVG